MKISYRKIQDFYEFFVQMPKLRVATVDVTHDSRGLWTIRNVWDHKELCRARGFKKALMAYRFFVSHQMWISYSGDH